MNFNLQRNEQMQTKQPFQTQNQITQQQNQQQLPPFPINQNFQRPTQQFQQGSQQFQLGNQQIQQGNQQFQLGNQQIQQGNQQYQQGNQQFQQQAQQNRESKPTTYIFETATINGK